MALFGLSPVFVLLFEELIDRFTDYGHWTESNLSLLLIDTFFPIISGVFAVSLLFLSQAAKSISYLVLCCITVNLFVPYLM
jgi:hypothetical protein